MNEDEVEFNLVSVPASAEQSVTREVVFGPDSNTLALLMEVDKSTGTLTFTIGNGPETHAIPALIPAMLRELADIVADLSGNGDYWDALEDQFN